MLSNKSVHRYLSAKIPYPYTKDDAKWFIEEGSKIGITRAIESEGILVGVIGMVPGQFEYARTGEIGYWLGEPYWGQGIATKAVQKMTELALESTNICRMVAPVFSPNVASMHVLEKCGFVRESIQKSALYKDETLYDAHLYVKLCTA